MRLSNTNRALIMGSIMERAADKLAKNDGNGMPLFLSHTLEYLDSLRELGRSNFTVKSVRSSLSICVRYAVKVKKISPHVFSISHCTEDFVRDWLVYEREVNHVSAATRNLRLTHLRGYIMFLSLQNELVGALYIRLSHIGEMRIEQKKKTVLNEKQVFSIIKIAREGRNGLRNATMIFIAFECALRASELVGLRVQDIVINDERIFVHVFGKNKRLRDLILAKDSAEVIQKYMQTVHKNSAPEMPLFFNLKKGRPACLTVRSFEYILKDCADKARLIDPKIPLIVHPHALRRSRATQLYQNGTPIELVSPFMGHSSLVTTTIYAIPSDEQLAEASGNSDLGKNWLHSDTDFNEDDLQKLMIMAGLNS